jgi:hypothetical protein
MQLDARSDVYSLGATLYELLALERPFSDDSLHALRTRLSLGNVSDITTVNNAIPRELGALINRAMARNPVDRYATASELADDLQVTIRSSRECSPNKDPRSTCASWALWLLMGALGVCAAIVAFLLLGRSTEQQIKVVSEGLVSYWMAEGSAQDSSGDNTGILIGGVTFSPGRLGQAFRFGGTNYVQASSLEMPAGNLDRTIFLWFNVTSNAAGEAFFAGYGEFGRYTHAYELFAVNNSLYFSQWGHHIRGGTFGLNTWHSAAVTNKGDSVTLYLDADPVATGRLRIDVPAGTNFYIGRIPGNLGRVRRLDGLVDEVRVYNRALSAQEIQALHSHSEC